MKLHTDESISRKVATYLGRLTWIDWAEGKGRALLDAPQPQAGQEPVEPVEVECGFRYAGQHWIWQQARDIYGGVVDVEAYPDEEITSHSAYAFCVGDRVVLLHKDKEQSEEEGQQVGQTGQTGNEEDGKEYVAVAVLAEDGASLVKRKVWPLYRLGHEAVVLNFGYNDEGNQGSGFPFITDDGTRSPINAFMDWKNHVRSLGTIGGTGNPRLVVTREQDAAGDAVYIPHAIHEFCESDEDIPYVPDIYMQTRPNWRGRIIGWSAQDEVLMDNIPLARVTGIADVEALITPSWRAVTRKFVHIDEQAKRLSVLVVTADCHFDWRTGAQAGESSGAADWRAPKYAFFVQRGSVEGPLCVYEAMRTPREELPEIALQVDEEASWLWRDMRRAVESALSSGFIRSTQIDNLMGDALDVVPPDGEAAMWFWGGCMMIGVNSYNPNKHDKRSKIGLAFSSARENDGSGLAVGALKIEKRIGYPVPWSPFNQDTLDSQVRLSHRDPDYANFGTVQEDRAEILGFEVQDAEGNVTGRSGYVEEEASRVGDNALVVRMSGHDNYVHSGVRDTALTKSFWHRTPDGDYNITEEVQKLSGHDDDVLGTLSTVVFTMVDVRRGVYGFWEITWFENAETKYVAGDDSTARPAESYRIKWQHYLWTKTSKARTHSYDYEIPFCLNGPYTNLEIDDRNSTVPDAELERSFVVRLLGVLFRTNDVKKWPTHRLWDVPRLYENGVEMKPTDICYKVNIFTFAPVHYISEFLQMCMSYRGSRRQVVRCEYETRFWVDRTILFRPYTFALHPLPNKYPWIWPHFRNLCQPQPSQAFSDPKDFFFESGVAGILYSESMWFDGLALDGEYYYWVGIRGVNGSESFHISPGMERLFTCTGRGDAVISVD